MTRSVQVQVNDYLRSFSRMTVPRLFTYASNDELAAFAAQSWLHVTNDRTLFVSPAATSLLLRTE